jgi:prepilin-type N-terminal cleavage/methylation domain-containing protein
LSKEKLMARHRAFTLLELLIVIGVIAILAGISIPNFYKAKERTLGKEATSSLKLISAAERIVRMESTDNLYVACSGTGCNSSLHLMLNATNWTYNVVCTGGDCATFTATADRVGTGGYFDCQYTFSDTDAEPNGNDSCP